MRVIFTDLDGVLNPHWKKNWSKSAVLIYNQICHEYDLKPVISSTWRINHTKEQLQNIFDEQGIEVEIYDYTPHLEQQNRGLEIKEWLKNNKVDNYVVIDDIVHNITPYVDNVIKVRSWVGLTTEEYIEMKKILDNDQVK
jgi:hypothetical protein